MRPLLGVQGDQLCPTGYRTAGDVVAFHTPHFAHACSGQRRFDKANTRLVDCTRKGWMNLGDTATSTASSFISGAERCLIGSSSQPAFPAASRRPPSVDAHRDLADRAWEVFPFHFHLILGNRSWRTAVAGCAYSDETWLGASCPNLQATTPSCGNDCDGALIKVRCLHFWCSSPGVRFWILQPARTVHSIR